MASHHMNAFKNLNRIDSKIKRRLRRSVESQNKREEQVNQRRKLRETLGKMSPCREFAVVLSPDSSFSEEISATPAIIKDKHGQEKENQKQKPSKNKDLIPNKTKENKKQVSQAGLDRLKMLEKWKAERKLLKKEQELENAKRKPFIVSARIDGQKTNFEKKWQAAQQKKNSDKQHLISHPPSTRTRSAALTASNTNQKPTSKTTHTTRAAAPPVVKAPSRSGPVTRSSKVAPSTNPAPATRSSSKKAPSTQSNVVTRAQSVAAKTNPPSGRAGARGANKVDGHVTQARGANPPKKGAGVKQTQNSIGTKNGKSIPKESQNFSKKAVSFAPEHFQFTAPEDLKLTGPHPAFVQTTLSPACVESFFGDISDKIPVDIIESSKSPKEKSFVTTRETNRNTSMFGENVGADPKVKDGFDFSSFTFQKDFLNMAAPSRSPERTEGPVEESLGEENSSFYKEEPNPSNKDPLLKKAEDEHCDKIKATPKNEVPISKEEDAAPPAASPNKNVSLRVEETGPVTEDTSNKDVALCVEESGPVTEDTSKKNVSLHVEETGPVTEDTSNKDVALCVEESDPVTEDTSKKNVSLHVEETGPVTEDTSNKNVSLHEEELASVTEDTSKKNVSVSVEESDPVTEDTSNKNVSIHGEKSADVPVESSKNISIREEELTGVTEDSTNKNVSVCVEESSPVTEDTSNKNVTILEEESGILTEDSSNKNVTLHEEEPSTVTEDSSKNVTLHEEEQSTVTEDSSNKNVTLHEEEQSTVTEDSSKNLTLQEEEPSTVTEDSSKNVTLHEEEPSTVTKDSSKNLTLQEEEQSTVTEDSSKNMTLHEEEPSTVTEDSSNKNVTLQEEEPSTVTEDSSNKNVTLHEEEQSTVTEDSSKNITLQEEEPSTVTEDSSSNNVSFHEEKPEGSLKKTLPLKMTPVRQSAPEQFKTPILQSRRILPMRRSLSETRITDANKSESGKRRRRKTEMCRGPQTPEEMIEVLKNSPMIEMSRRKIPKERLGSVPFNFEINDEDLTAANISVSSNISADHQATNIPEESPKKEPEISQATVAKEALPEDRPNMTMEVISCAEEDSSNVTVNSPTKETPTFKSVPGAKEDTSNVTIDSPAKETPTVQLVPCAKEDSSNVTIDSPAKETPTVELTTQEIDEGNSLKKLSNSLPILVKHDVPYFRNLIENQTDLLNSLSDEFEVFLPDVSEEVQGQIRTVIGQTKLLISKRFRQFIGLVDNCEFKTSEKETTCDDLQGFWDMVDFQVEDVKMKFEDLKKLQANDWKIEVKKIPVEKKKNLVKKTKAVVPKDPKRKGRSEFALFMAQKKKEAKENQIKKTVDPESSLKVFDGLFFKVESPVKSPRIHCNEISSSPLPAPTFVETDRTVELSPTVTTIHLTEEKSKECPMDSSETSLCPEKESSITPSPLEPCPTLPKSPLSVPPESSTPSAPRSLPRRSFLPAIPSPLLQDITPSRKVRSSRKSIVFADVEGRPSPSVRKELEPLETTPIQNQEEPAEKILVLQTPPLRRSGRIRRSVTPFSSHVSKTPSQEYMMQKFIKNVLGFDSPKESPSVNDAKCPSTPIESPIFTPLKETNESQTSSTKKTRRRKTIDSQLTPASCTKRRCSARLSRKSLTCDEQIESSKENISLDLNINMDQPSSSKKTPTQSKRGNRRMRKSVAFCEEVSTMSFAESSLLSTPNNPEVELEDNLMTFTP